jgi:hypothetical protein
MPELMTIKRVALGPHHLQPARIGVTIRGGGTTRPVPPFVALQIAHYPGGNPITFSTLPKMETAPTRFTNRSKKH